MITLLARLLIPPVVGLVLAAGTGTVEDLVEVIECSGVCR